MKIKIDKDAIVLDSYEVYIIKMKSPDVGEIIFNDTVYTDYATAEAVIKSLGHSNIRQWLEIETMYLN